jgi:hypothetical protein
MSWWRVVQRRILGTSNHVNWPVSLCCLFSSLTCSALRGGLSRVSSLVWCLLHFWWMASCTYDMPRSACSVALETCHGASTIILRILDYWYIRFTRTAPLLTPKLSGGKWSALRSGRFVPKGNSPSNQLNLVQGGLQGRSGWEIEKKRKKTLIHLSGIEHKFIGLTACKSVPILIEKIQAPNSSSRSSNYYSNKERTGASLDAIIQIIFIRLPILSKSGIFVRISSPRLMLKPQRYTPEELKQPVLHQIL